MTKQTSTPNTKTRSAARSKSSRTGKTTTATRTTKAGVHPVVHHARRVYRLTPKFVHGMVAGAFLGLLVVGIIRNTGDASALTISSPRDCDTNAVITCGALTTAEVQKHYTDKGVAQIYNYYKISAADIQAIGSTAVSGRVFKDGTVRIGNTIVATGAISAGRVQLTGSTGVTSGGVRFYNSAPNTSFVPNSLAAFVVMQDGQFKYAILGACGNPVMATPVPPKPAPPAPPEPPITTPSTQAAPSTPVVTPAAATPETLPNTGPGAAIIIGLLAVIGGYLYHVTHRRIQRRRQHGPRA